MGKVQRKLLDDADFTDDGSTVALHLRPSSMALVFLGGAVGTAARYLLKIVLPDVVGTWPWGTFVANIAGALVIGILLETLSRAGADRGRRRMMRLLIGTGFCGGLTTYSTFAVEFDLTVRAHDPVLALAYLFTTVLSGMVAVIIGIGIAGHRAGTGGHGPSDDAHSDAGPSDGGGAR